MYVCSNVCMYVRINVCIVILILIALCLQNVLNGYLRKFLELLTVTTPLHLTSNQVSYHSPESCMYVVMWTFYFFLNLLLHYTSNVRLGGWHRQASRSTCTVHTWKLITLHFTFRVPDGQCARKQKATDRAKSLEIRARSNIDFGGVAFSVINTSKMKKLIINA